MLVTDVANVTYLTGFRGDDSALLLTHDGQWFITDSRYTEQAAAEAPQCELVQRTDSLLNTAAGIFERTDAHSLAVEGENLSHAAYLRLADALDGVDPTPKENLVETLREVKDEDEIERMRKAMTVAADAFQEVTAQLAAGQSERDVATALDNAMRRRGARQAAFESIVAARERSSLPHAQATDAVIGPGDAVLFDWGAEVDLYCSDTTRVVFLAPPDDRWCEIYNIVLTAQCKAIDTVRAGVAMKDVDAAARDHIAAAGYGDQFGHGLGHGVGLRVHERPSLHKNADATLTEGMVVTVDPGIYLPGWGGVRIEDLVCVRKDGPEVLTKLPKDIDSATLS